MWLRILHIWFEACYYLLSLLLCQKFYLFIFYDLIDFKPYVCLICKTCPSMTNICTTIGLYAKSFDIWITRVFQISPVLIWSGISGLFLPGSSKSVITGHVWPLARTYSANWTEHIQLPSRTYPALELAGIKGEVHTPLNPSLLFHPLFNSLCLQALPRWFWGPPLNPFNF
jgi:hypothetical protein